MTHRIVVNVETGEVTQVEYTPEEQAAHDAAVAAQAAAEAQALAEAQAVVTPTEPVVTPSKPTP
jgi:hypothetical protein